MGARGGFHTGPSTQEAHQLQGSTGAGDPASSDYMKGDFTANTSWDTAYDIHALSITQVDSSLADFANSNTGFEFLNSATPESTVGSSAASPSLQEEDNGPTTPLGPYEMPPAPAALPRTTAASQQNSTLYDFLPTTACTSTAGAIHQPGSPSSSALDFIKSLEPKNNKTEFRSPDMSLPFDLTDTQVFMAFLDPLITGQQQAIDGSIHHAQARAASFDKVLDSPIGLSPFDAFLTTPLFGEDDIPELEPDAPLFSSTSTSATYLRPNPPPPSRRASNVSFASTAYSASPPRSSNACHELTPAPTPQPSGFRGRDTQLLPIDAPIQSRSYVAPSTTSRKRKTVQVEKELAKRQKAAEEIAALEEDDIPSDIVDKVERKRLQNTLSARKSRQRKQARLGDLEDENARLVEHNEALIRRIEELEMLLRSR